MTPHPGRLKRIGRRGSGTAVLGADEARERVQIVKRLFNCCSVGRKHRMNVSRDGLCSFTLSRHHEAEAEDTWNLAHDSERLLTKRWGEGAVAIC